MHLGPEMLLSVGIEYELSADRALGVKGGDMFGSKAQGRMGAVTAKALSSTIAMAQAGAEVRGKGRAAESASVAVARGS